MFHAISDGKMRPFTEIGVAQFEFSGYQIIATLSGTLRELTALGGFLFSAFVSAPSLACSR